MLARNRQTDFSKVAHIQSPRSKFNRLSEILTTFNQGDLIPFYNDIDILPGDTHSLTTSFVLRTVAPFTRPLLAANFKLDYWYFYVPYTQLYDIQKCKNLFGEAVDASWVATQEVEAPQLKFNKNMFGTALAADLDSDGYMRMKDNYTGGNNLAVKDFVTKYSNSVERYLFMPAIPTKTDASGMLCKAFSWDNSGTLNYGVASEDIVVAAWTLRAYHRIYNYFFRREDLIAPVTMDTSDTTKVYTKISDFTPVYKVSRYKDYMAANLPQPQKAVAGDVYLPLGTKAPLKNGTIDDDMVSPNWYWDDNGTIKQLTADNQLYSKANNNGTGVDGVTYTPTNGLSVVTPLYADLSNATAAGVNALRMAVATQRIYEKFAMYGSRMEESLRQFGVVCPELQLQIPEYIGGYTVPLNFAEVTNTSADLGEVGAKSVTTHIKHDVTKSFTQWGVIIGVCSVRQNRIYSNGIERGYFRKRIFDYFWPTFNNLGNQPTYNRELFIWNRANEAFGYNEAWAEYRYKPSRISGQILDFADFKAYTVADMYEDCPYLGQEWIEEDNTQLRYAMGISADNPINDFIIDIAVLDSATRPMTLNSIPGLMDHM